MGIGWESEGIHRKKESQDFNYVICLISLLGMGETVERGHRRGSAVVLGHEVGGLDLEDEKEREDL